MKNSFTDNLQAIDVNIRKMPLGVAWIVNFIGWVLFLSTFNHAIEIATGIVCLICVYVGYIHYKSKTSPFLGLNSLSSGNLIWSSAIEAIWMFAWGFGFFGDFNFNFLNYFN
jgi:hypothetical protein